jgi:hypothetical protein
MTKNPDLVALTEPTTASDTSSPIVPDFDCTFGAIHGSSNRMQDNVLRLQEHVIEKEKLYKWAGQLRFISAIQDDEKHECEGRHDEGQYMPAIRQPREPNPDEIKAHEDQVLDFMNGSYPLLGAVAECDNIPLSSYQALWRVHRYRLGRDFQESLAGDTQGQLSVDSDPCSCSRAPKFPGAGVSRFRITDPGEYGSCVHYIAVSYRWLSRKDPATASKVGHYDIQSKTVERARSIAPNKVLDRAIQFAAHCGVPFVWIDQECIRQSVKEEQEMGIQSMDLVYQRAVASIGLIDVTLDTQDEIDTLDRWLRLDDLDADQYIRSVAILERLMNDQWMHRAWIYQELAAAGPRMVLLLKCRPGLRRAFRERSHHPRRSLKIPGEYDILPSELIAAMDYLENWPILSGHTIPRPLELHLENLSRHLQSTMSKETYVIDSLVGHLQAPAPWELFDHDRGSHDSTYRPLICASGALRGLEGRINSRIADRIAIAGNLCAYNKRLDTSNIKDLGALGASMSTNMYALALLNGDLTLVFAVNDATSGNYTEDFQWFPTSKSIKTAIFDTAINHLPYRLNKCLLSKDGVHSQGYLWDVSEKIDIAFVFRQPKDELRKRLSPILDSHDRTVLPDEKKKLPESVEKLSIWVTWEVIRSLYAIEQYRPLACTLYEWFTSFATIKQGRAHHVGAGEIVGFQPELTSEQFQAEGSGIDCYWILKRLLQDQSLWTGRLAGSLWAGRIVGTSADAPLAAIFDVDRCGQVFTPASDIMDQSVKIRQGAVSMAVEECGVSEQDQSDILSCRRLARGVWGEVGSEESYCLAWSTESTDSGSGVSDLKMEASREVAPPEHQSSAHLSDGSERSSLDVPARIRAPLILPRKTGMIEKRVNHFTECTGCQQTIENTDYLECVPCDITLCNICHMKNLGCAGRHEMPRKFVLRYIETPLRGDVRGALGVCVALKQFAVLQSLLRRGFIKYFCPASGRGRTALHEAVEHDLVEYTIALVDAGADVSIPEEVHGKTALHIAVERDSLAIVRVLLTQTTDVSIPEEVHGKTALHTAAEQDKLAIVQALLPQTKNITFADKYGETALHYAAENNHLRVVEAICDSDWTPVDCRDSARRSPYMCAEQNGHVDVCAYLQSRGMKYTDPVNRSIADEVWSSVSKFVRNIIGMILYSGSADS